MSQTAFTWAVNRESFALALPYAPGSGVLTVVSAAGLPAGVPGTLKAIRLSCTRLADGARVILIATGLAGNQFTGVSAAEGTADISLAPGDVAAVQVSAGYLNDAYAAIQDLQAQVDGLGGGGIDTALLDATASASPGAVNVVASPGVNVVGAGADACVVLGGTSAFPHNIGAAALATIPGGYDNHVGGNSIMAVLLGAHGLIDAAGGHGSIGGGSYHAVHGDYGRVGGGTQNVAAGAYAAICGGRQNSTGTAVTTLAAQAAAGTNTITTAAALVAGRTVYIDYGALTESFTVLSIVGTTSTLSGNLAATHASGTRVVSDAGDVTDATVCGGQSNMAVKTQATVGGGLNNKAQGTASTVGGGTNNNASQAGTAIVGGDQNVANATYAAIGGGQSNAASGSYSTIGGGSANAASQLSATIGGGANNAASGQYAAVAGGFSNTASGSYAGVPSGRGANAYKNYSRALAGGFFAVAGDAQAVDLPMRRQTTNATATELRTDGSGEQLGMPDNTCWRFRVAVVGWRTDTHLPVADIRLDGTIYRQSGAATTALFGAVTKTANAANAAGTDANATADATLGGLSIKVTGLAGVTVRWSALVEVVEVAG